MRTLLIDNHDSYTFNLFQLLAAVNGEEPLVAVNDDPLLRGALPRDVANIVVSPGPGRPARQRDVGHLPALLATCDLPVLGVCLGHQLVAHLAGAVVDSAPRPRHGHLERVTHAGDELFAGVPTTFSAVRYHSLCVLQPLPKGVVATAWADDGVIMALRLEGRRRYGVQFHPESLASEHGGRILANFRDVSARPSRRWVGAPSVPAQPVVSQVELITAVVDGAVDTEALFLDVAGGRGDAFWLDSSRLQRSTGRWSFLGYPDGALGEVLTYRQGDGHVTVRRPSGSCHLEPGDAFTVLERRLADRRMASPGLPFDLVGGYVGWFGYECRADCGSPSRHRADTADAAWLFADRLVAVDHEAATTTVLAVLDGTERERRRAQQWVDEVAARVRRSTEDHRSAAGPGVAGQTGHAPLGTGHAPTGADHPPPDRRWIEAHLDRDHEQYLRDVERCLQELRRGESYEICLTNAVRLPFDSAGAWPFYRRLRRCNPAPYAAFVRVGGTTVMSSSPERFLRIWADGRVETRPIKGTAPRHHDAVADADVAARLAADPKTRAENLMIADLMRNDLGRVCQVGSVRVDDYLSVATYATVHQLFSTISGHLRPGVGPVECVRRCFPGGSMTGAPKLRTMEILDDLEARPRGIYSGALGYFGLTGGADLGIVIRTAVSHGGTLVVGAGGAIVLDSDPAAELEEMLLKAEATLRACRVRPAVTGAPR